MADKLYVDIDKAVGMDYLSDWYQNSIDDTKPPVWTDEHIYELVNDFLIIPNDTSTADVAEVKHGEWITNKPNEKQMKDFHDMGIGKAMALQSIYWTCSECGTWGTPRYKYCPECGAKMDGRSDAE